MRERILPVLYKIKNICYSILKGAILNEDKDFLKKDGPKGLFYEGLLFTLILVMAILVLFLAGGGIEKNIKGVMDSLFS